MDRCLPPPLPLAGDDDLVARLQAGDVDAPVTQLERRYGQRLQRFVRSMVRDAHLAQDVTQEVFEKVLTRSDHYQPGTNFRAWLFEVARNQALSALRRQQRTPRPMSALRPQDDGDPLDAMPSEQFDRRLEEAEFEAAFARAVEALPERYRTVFELCVRQGKPYQEAARRLGLPTGTVAIRILRARKRLFADLQQHLGRLRRPPACLQQAAVTARRCRAS
jgi:RNA polymerase sigma-70 factor (ECF subfamily)